MFIKHSFLWCAIFYVYFENTQHIFGHRIWHVPWLFLRFRWGIKYLGKSLLFRFFKAVTLFVIFFLCFHIVCSLSDGCDFEWRRIMNFCKRMRWYQKNWIRECFVFAFYGYLPVFWSTSSFLCLTIPPTGSFQQAPALEK